MKEPKPWECEGKDWTLKEVEEFIDNLHKVVHAEIKKVFGDSGWKGRDCPISVYIGNRMTHNVSRPFWPTKDELIETQRELLNEFMRLGIYGKSEAVTKLADLKLIDLEQEDER